MQEDEQIVLAEFKKDIEYIKEVVKEIRTIQKTDFVTKEQFEPYKQVVTGLVATVLIAVVGAIISLVIK